VDEFERESENEFV